MQRSFGKLFHIEYHQITNIADIRMVVPSRWIKEWLMFSHLKIGKEPKEITMQSLLVKDPSVPEGLRPNRSLLPPNAEGTEKDAEAPGHYRQARP